jgi:hypothetical protein
LKQGRLAVGAALLTCLLAGCSSVPMTYAQWQKEQADRARFERAGEVYKSPSELRTEAAEMRRIAQETSFAATTR